MAYMMQRYKRIPVREELYHELIRICGETEKLLGERYTMQNLIEHFIKEYLHRKASGH